jgi:hypothetical protein
MSVEADEIWAILKGISETNKELSKAHQEFREEQKIDEQLKETDCVDETAKMFECSANDLLNRYGFLEGDMLIAEEKPLVEKACILLMNALGIIDDRWRPFISRSSQHYVLFHDINTDKVTTIYDLAEIDRRKIYAVIEQKKLNWISIPFDSH